MNRKKIAFIGPGVMAEAMIAGLLKKKLASPADITASGPREERGAELHKKYGIQTTADNAAAVHEADDGQEHVDDTGIVAKSAQRAQPAVEHIGILADEIGGGLDGPAAQIPPH